MSLGRTDELERFKQDINLIQYTAGFNFVFSRNESSEAYAVLRRESPKEKLVVTKAANGHWIYFNVHNEMDSGTIIDFIQNRRSINIGMIRLDLRRWTGNPSVQLQSDKFPSITKSTFNRESVLAAYSRNSACLSSPYLNSRGIPDEVLASPRFKNMARIDERGNIIFPHYDKQGITGYEIKNEGYTGFAKGGKRALWSSQCFHDDDTIIFVESALDAISYHIIKGQPGYRYHSVAGAIGGEQQPLLARVLQKALTNGWRVINGFDNDGDGEKYHCLIQELAPDGLQVERDPPPAKDWNEIIDQRLRCHSI